MTYVYNFFNIGYSTDVQQSMEPIVVDNNATEHWNDSALSWNSTQQSLQTTVLEDQSMLSSTNVDSSHNVGAPAQISVKSSFGYFDNADNSIIPQVNMLFCN